MSPGDVAGWPPMTFGQLLRARPWAKNALFFEQRGSGSQRTLRRTTPSS
ncbi:MAG: hypothetical protein QOG58_4596, partial [Caballeronia sp.]|nr:hypothetical protein [Caballeronia sp.]